MSGESKGTEMKRYRVTTWNGKTTETHVVTAPNSQAAIHAVDDEVTDIAPCEE